MSSNPKRKKLRSERQRMNQEIYNNSESMDQYKTTKNMLEKNVLNNIKTFDDDNKQERDDAVIKVVKQSDAFCTKLATEVQQLIDKKQEDEKQENDENPPHLSVEKVTLSGLTYMAHQLAASQAQCDSGHFKQTAIGTTKEIDNSVLTCSMQMNAEFLSSGHFNFTLIKMIRYGKDNKSITEVEIPSCFAILCEAVNDNDVNNNHNNSNHNNRSGHEEKKEEKRKENFVQHDDYSLEANIKMYVENNKLQYVRPKDAINFIKATVDALFVDVFDYILLMFVFGTGIIMDTDLENVKIRNEENKEKELTQFIISELTDDIHEKFKFMVDLFGVEGLCDSFYTKDVVQEIILYFQEEINERVRNHIVGSH